MKYIFILIFSINSFQLSAQELDSNGADSLQTKNSFLKKSIVPFTLVSIGVFANNSQFEKDLRNDIRAQTGEDFQFNIDTYVSFVPIAEMYLADAFQVEAKNHWFDQTKYLVISNVISAVITNSLKRVTLKSRPDGSSNRAFPSNHSSFAFTNASVLRNEFENTAPVLAYSGYLFSTSTGLLRVLNDRHWISDVLVGAGIGIIATELVYYFEPLKNFNPFRNSENINFVPQIDQNCKGFYFSYTF